VAGHDLDAARFPVPLDIKLNDGDKLVCGNLEFTVIHNPGHTKGSISFLAGKYLLDGDTLFPHGPGWTANHANFEQEVKSLQEKIFVLPDDTRVFPGHGEPTVLEREKEEFKIFSSRPHRPDLCGTCCGCKIRRTS